MRRQHIRDRELDPQTVQPFRPGKAHRSIRGFGLTEFDGHIHRRLYDKWMRGCPIFQTQNRQFGSFTDHRQSDFGRQALSGKVTRSLFDHGRLQRAEQFYCLGTSRLVAGDHQHRYTKMASRGGVQAIFSRQNTVQPDVGYPSSGLCVSQDRVQGSSTGVVPDEEHARRFRVHALHHGQRRGAP